MHQKQSKCIRLHLIVDEMWMRVWNRRAKCIWNNYVVSWKWNWIAISRRLFWQICSQMKIHASSAHHLHLIQEKEGKRITMWTNVHTRYLRSPVFFVHWFLLFPCWKWWVTKHRLVTQQPKFSSLENFINLNETVITDDSDSINAPLLHFNCWFHHGSILHRWISKS